MGYWQKCLQTSFSEFCRVQFWIFRTWNSEADFPFWIVEVFPVISPILREKHDW